MAEAATAGQPTAPGVFSRKASGLVRVGSSLDVFIFNVGLVSVGIAIAYNQFYGPSLYPGAQPWIATLLAAAGMIFVATAFYCWSVVFPRSGGVYVFLSRTINPGVAFVMSVVETVILLYYAALAAGLSSRSACPASSAPWAWCPAIATLVSWGATVAKPAGVFWIGTLIIVVAGLLLVSGTRRYFTVQRVLFVIAVAGLAVIAVVMIFGSRNSFQSSLTSLTGLNSGKVISSATKGGFATAPHQLQREREVPDLAAAAAARRGPVGRHRRRDQEGPPVPAVRHARRGGRHRPGHRAVRDPVGQGLRARVPGRGRLQRADRLAARRRRPRRGSPCWPASWATT